MPALRLCDEPCYSGILICETAEYTVACMRRQRLRQRYVGAEASKIAGAGLFCVGLRRHLDFPLESRGYGKPYGRMPMQAWPRASLPCRV